MRTVVLALATAAAVALSIGLGAASGAAGTIRLAQADNQDAKMGPVASPKVVIEEPRPPSAVIETEGRGEDRNCRPATTTERQDGTKVAKPERRCER
jgi:hypothetical protein